MYEAYGYEELKRIYDKLADTKKRNTYKYDYHATKTKEYLYAMLKNAEEMIMIHNELKRREGVIND